MIHGDDIAKIKIGLASPEEIRNWSQGEVVESETINYRTYKPERGGLYAEEIFGPENDYECSCGKYRGRKYEGLTCEKCGVLVTTRDVRRTNMGHIELASPVIHFWFLQGLSSPLGILLGILLGSVIGIWPFDPAYLEGAARAAPMIATATAGAGAGAPAGYVLADYLIGAGLAAAGFLLTAALGRINE